MGSHVFWLFVTCYLTCIPYRDAFGESTLAKVFATINDASETNTKSILQIKNTASIKTQTSPAGITLKGDWSKAKDLQDSPLVTNGVSQTKTSSSSRKTRCYKYCIQKLETREENGNSFKDSSMCISWFAGNQSEKVDFSLESNTGLNTSRQISIDNKNSTLLNKCRLYLDSDCNIINVGENSFGGYNKLYSNSHFNQRDMKIIRNPFSDAIPRYSKKLLHRTNLNGYTETNFHIDPNITEIIINISGNLERAVLAIPINRTTRRLEITMSMARVRTRVRNKKGVVIGARSLPSGEWCVKLMGAENSKYGFDVVVSLETNEEDNNKNEVVNVKSASEFSMYDEKEDFDEPLDIKQTVDRKITIINDTERFNKPANENISNDQISSMFLTDSGIKSNSKSIFERSVEITNPSDEETMISNFPASSSMEFAVENVTNHPTLYNNSLTSYSHLRNSQNASNKELIHEKIFAAHTLQGQQQKVQARMSEVASLNEDVDVGTKSFAIENVSVKMADNDHNQGLSSDVSRSSNEDVLGRRKMLIEVNANSNLIAAAGTTHRIIFDVSNNCFLPVRYAIRARSSPFRIYNVQPIYTWLYPGQTSQVAVDTIIPLGTQNTVNTLTLSLDGTEIAEKTVYLYTQNTVSRTNDDARPSIEYSFNSNCAGKTDRQRCEKTFWSADITVQDSDSGLKRVISTPNDVYPRMTFISGTKEPVRFYYSSTCCSTTARITAIDVSNNQYSRTLDVTAWDNLSQGEIAAITLGALLLLFLLILLVVAIIYCFRKRSSRDLPYSQRYGSRPPARTERTSF